MSDTREPVLIVGIDPAHMSTRELALRAMYGQQEADRVVIVEPPPRPVDFVPVKLRAPKATFERATVKKPYQKQKSAALKRLLAK